MKILMNYEERKQYPDCPEAVPDSFLNEKHALKIHSQTLKHLNERGGMGPSEIIGNIDKKSFHEIVHMCTREAIDRIKELLKEAPHE